MKTIESPRADHSCTSFCLVNHGHAVFGANYDHGQIREGLLFVNKRNVAKSYWEPDPTSEHARWTSRYGSVTFNLVMSQFAWGGMNEAGLVISTMELPGSQSPAPDERPWLYSNFWVQYLLDRYATVKEVIASDSLVRIKDYVDHYLVCDRQGNCATIEFLEGKRVCHTGKDLPVKVLANNTYEESVAAWDRYRVQKSQGEPVSIRDPLLLRFVLAADRVTRFKSTDAESAVRYAFDTLEEVSGQKVNGSPTHWSIVFDTKDLGIFFRTSTHPQVRRIHLPDLDFSWQAPARMLDVHAKLSGDITDKLPLYSSSRHFEHALHAGKRWGGDIDPDLLRKQIKVLEDLPCGAANAVVRGEEMEGQAALPDPAANAAASAAAVAAQHIAAYRALPVRRAKEMWALRREFARSLKDAPSEFVLAVARALFYNYDNPGHASALLMFHQATFRTLGEDEIEEFGQGINSWGTVDTFARRLSGPAWLKGQISDELIHAWARSGDRWWRRAALVSTVALNVRSKGGYGDIPRTLQVCRMLVEDRDDMVVKAMSWALRELVVHDPDAVRGFLAQHEDVLAARVKREVRNKLTTGLKNPKRQKQ